MASSASTETKANTQLVEGSLRRLDSSYIPECANVMAQAFSTSPPYMYIFQGTQEYRVQALEWLFVKNLDLMMKKCPESVLRGFVDSDGKVLACLLWTPSEYAALSMWEMLQAGLWQVPFRFGVATLKRLVGVLDDMEAAKKSDAMSSSAKKNYFKLERMVVHPEFQGKGIGSKALQEVLKEDSSSGVDSHLDTQEERNVRFYQRLGWEVCRDQDYCENDPEYKFHSWHMIRKAQS